MVLIDSRTRQKAARRTRSGAVVGHKKEEMSVYAIGCVGSFAVLLVLFMMFGGSSSSSSSLQGTKEQQQQQQLLLLQQQDRNHPQLQMKGPNSDSYDALAMDIINTLHCRELLNATSNRVAYTDDDAINRNNGLIQRRRRRRRRRLQEAAGAAGEQAQEGEGAAEFDTGDLEEEEDMNMMDDEFREGEWDVGIEDILPTGKHLFCMAAMSSALPSLDKVLVEPWKSRLQCDATHTRQAALLDLWGEARGELPSSHILSTVLGVAREHDRTLVGNQVFLWAPSNDEGLDYMLNELNKEENNDVDHGGVYGLGDSLGHNKLFVDVGSCLGTTSLAVALLYPGTQIVSIEAAAPNWLLQQMNWRCNDVGGFSGGGLDDGKQLRVILGGVGPALQTMSADFLWRPSSTTATRAWTPARERIESDLVMTVKLKSWRKLLQEAEVSASDRIDVLNVDCEGCEYNLIPALEEKEFQAITTVMGGLHWGYIPKERKPSSKRARETHERLCQHENFARASKECCAFPNLQVTSSNPGEVLVKGNGGFPPTPGTVADVAGDFCNDFREWRQNNFLDDIQDDFGWFQMSSTAD